MEPSHTEYPVCVSVIQSRASYRAVHICFHILTKSRNSTVALRKIMEKRDLKTIKDMLKLPIK